MLKVIFRCCSVTFLIYICTIKNALINNQPQNQNAQQMTTTEKLQLIPAIYEPQMSPSNDNLLRLKCPSHVSIDIEKAEITKTENVVEIHVGNTFVYLSINFQHATIVIL